MSKARELAALGNAYSDGALSNRNLIINGAMQVAQRGTSKTITTADTGFKTVDRFRSKFFGSSWTGVSHTTEEQSTDAPNGFDRSLKLTALTAQDYSNALGSWVQYTFENQNIVSLRDGNGLKEFTVSFWVKASKSGNVTVSVEKNYSYSTYVTVNYADTWEYKSVVIPATSNDMGIDYSGSPNGSGITLQLGMGSNGSWLASTDGQWNDVSTARGVLSAQQTNFHASVNDYIAFTGVQLEIGDTATPFEHRSYGQELALCERFLQTLPLGGGAYAGLTGYDGSIALVHLRQTMRASPSLLPTGITGYGGGNTEYRVYLMSSGGGGFAGPPVTVNFFIDYSTPTKVRIVASHAAGWYNTTYEVTGSFIDVGAGCKVLLEAEL